VILFRQKKKKCYSRRHLPNSYLRNATPPAKRMRLEEPTDEKSNEDEDASDLSHDEL